MGWVIAGVAGGIGMGTGIVDRVQFVEPGTDKGICLRVWGLAVRVAAV